MSTSSNKDDNTSASSAEGIKVTVNYWPHVTSAIGNTLTAKSLHIMYYKGMTAVCFRAESHARIV
jgi:hypothetical protein